MVVLVVAFFLTLQPKCLLIYLLTIALCSPLSFWVNYFQVKYKFTWLLNEDLVIIFRPFLENILTSLSSFFLFFSSILISENQLPIRHMLVPQLAVDTRAQKIDKYIPVFTEFSFSWEEHCVLLTPFHQSVNYQRKENFSPLHCLLDTEFQSHFPSDIWRYWVLRILFNEKSAVVKILIPFKIIYNFSLIFSYFTCFSVLL